MSEKENTIPSRQLIGEILVRRNIISPKQLAEALEIQKKREGFVGEILVKLGYVQERDIVVALVVQCSLPYIAVNKYQIDPTIIKIIPKEIAKSQYMIPLDRVGNVLSVVMAHPLTPPLKEQLEKLTGCQIATFIATKSEICDALARYYREEK